MRKIGSISAVALSLATGCSAPSGARVDVSDTSICEINAHPQEYLGKTVVVSATHHTVGTYEDYLVDDCSDHNTLGIDEWTGYASVRKYERARKMECTGSDLCLLTADVVVELTIEMGAGGHLVSGPTTVGKLNRVLSYRFVRK